jgi:hypothetical protein
MFWLRKFFRLMFWLRKYISTCPSYSCCPVNVIVPGQVVDQVRTHGCMGSHKKIEKICDEPGARQ